MLMSQLFGRTLRQAPSGHTPVTALALRAALVRVVSEELVLLHLGELAAAKLAENLLELTRAGQAVHVPPGDMTSAWCDLMARELQSYRQLPVALFSRRVIWHSEEPRGLARPRWITGFQWLWADGCEERTLQSRNEWSHQMERWFQKNSWTPESVEWHRHASGWAILSEHAPDKLLGCSSCGYLAVSPWARFKRTSIPDEPIGKLDSVATPDTDTIEALATFLDVPVSRTLKAVFFSTDQGKLVFAVLRGDLEVSLSKLRDAVGCQTLTPARNDSIRSFGAEPGYASPVGLRVPGHVDGADFIVIADTSIESGANFVAGANKPGFHLTGVNFPRDFEVTKLADIAQAAGGDACPECDGILHPRQGYVIGGWQDDACMFGYVDEHGAERQGSASQGTIFLEPMLAALLDEYHDEVGLLWPGWLAPYDVYLVELRAPEAARETVEALSALGLSALHDDRDVSAGVKFADADLIGLPLRITVSKRSLEKGGVEVASRRGEKSHTVPIADLAEALRTVTTSVM